MENGDFEAERKHVKTRTFRFCVTLFAKAISASITNNWGEETSSKPRKDVTWHPSREEAVICERMEKGTLYITPCYYITHITHCSYSITQLSSLIMPKWNLTPISILPSSEHAKDFYSYSRAWNLGIRAHTQQRGCRTHQHQQPCLPPWWNIPSYFEMLFHDRLVS